MGTLVGSVSSNNSCRVIATVIGGLSRVLGSRFGWGGQYQGIPSPLGVFDYVGFG